MIRPIALGIVRRGEDLLVFRGEDPYADPPEFFRPLGGGIEFGESAEEALRREFVEELGAAAGRPRGWVDAHVTTRTDMPERVAEPRSR